MIGKQSENLLFFFFISTRDFLEVVMAITDRSDELGQALGCKVSRRLQIWLWHYFASNGYRLKAGASDFLVRNEMANVINANPAIKVGILNARGEMLVPDEYLSWVKDDVRQSEWILNHLKPVLDFKFVILSKELKGRDRVVAFFDVAKWTLVEKISIVTQSEFEWNIFVQNDVIFEWFRKKDKVERIGFAWNYLVKNYSQHTYGKSVIDSFENLLLFFFRHFSSLPEQKLIVDKIKKSWSQKQYRENLEDKKQCNLTLSVKTIKLLDRLSEKYDISRSEIVDLLVRDESEKEVYISERLDRRRNLLL